MTSRVATVESDTLLCEVAKRMSQTRLSCIVIVEQNHPIAVVTARDMTKIAAQLLNGEPVKTLREVMSPGLVTLNVDASCNQALELSNIERICRMVIVDNDGKLAGVATQSDLLRAHAKDLPSRNQNLNSRL